MPYNLNAEARAELVSEVVTRLLADGGQAAVTTRAVANATGLGWQALVHHFGGRRRLMSLSCHLAGRAHVLRVSNRIDAAGVGGVIPEDEESRAFDRAWLAWTDLGRFDDHIGHPVAEHEARETHVIGRVLGSGASRDDVEILSATARGLRAAVCRLEDPMSPEEARRLLERLTGMLHRQGEAA